MVDKREFFVNDGTITTAELFMRTLIIAPPPGSGSLADLEYISGLVDDLQLFDSDHGEENARLLLEKDCPDGRSFKMELDIFGVLASSRFRKTTRRDASPPSKTDRKSDQLLIMIVRGVLGIESGITFDQETSYEEMSLKDDISNPTLQRTFVTGDSGLLSRDVILRIASYPELSSLFLIGRFREHRKYELEIVAVAESDNPTRSCGVDSDDYAEHSGCINLRIFEIPNCVKGKSIFLKRYTSNQFGAEVVFDMASIAQLVNLLSSRSSGKGAQKWCWKSEKMSPMREVVLSGIRTCESRPSKRKLATDAPADTLRQSKRTERERSDPFMKFRSPL